MPLTTAVEAHILSYVKAEENGVACLKIKATFAYLNLPLDTKLILIKDDDDNIASGKGIYLTLPQTPSSETPATIGQSR